MCFLKLARSASASLTTAVWFPGKGQALFCLFALGAFPAFADRPTVTAPPDSSTNCVGDTVLMSVTAVGIDPLNYQWYLNATTAVAGATSEILTINGAQLTDAGNYTVVIGNGDDSGSTTSSPPALLVINPLPAVSVNSATICAGNSAILTATTDAADPAICGVRTGRPLLRLRCRRLPT